VSIGVVKPLDGWPVRSIRQRDAVRMDWPAFRDQVRAPADDIEVAMAPCSVGGAANVLLRQSVDPSSKPCRQFLGKYLQPRQFAWEAADWVLLNRACFLAVKSGAVLLEDGSIVTETLFDWPGERALAEALGSELTAPVLEEALSKAPELPNALYAPLLSRWSNVYGHVLSEGLVQDALLSREGLAESITYVVPSELRGGQVVALAEQSCRTTVCDAPLVRVPRILFSTSFYRHCRLGTDFRAFAERKRLDVLGAPGTAESLGEKIYVARGAAPARPMLNEPELIARLSARGFSIFRSEGLSLLQQAAAFHDARLIVGPFGSGLVNAAFAAPGAILCELRPLNSEQESPIWDTFYRNLAATMGFTYCVHVSENPPHTDPWTAELDEILQLVASMDV
jgi:hypothetical protein